MGTTSDKLTYLNTTKQELKEAINNLGGSIDEQTTFRQYANQLQNVYDNLPKTEYQEGTEVTLSNCLKGKLDFDEDNGKKVVGIGQTEQESTEGYNLIDTNETIAETTKNGVTYSLKNGVFTFNGTASAGFDIYLNNLVSLKSGSYTFGPRNESGSYTGILGKYGNVSGSGNVLEGSQVKNYANSTLNSDYNNVRLHLYIASGAVFTNYSFKILLVSGTYTSSTMPEWEPYTNGPAPNPNYQFPIEVVRGKSILPNNGTSKTIAGVTFTVNEDKSITANGTATTTIIWNLLNDKTSGDMATTDINLSKGTYTLSGCPSGGSNSTYKIDVNQRNGAIFTDYGNSNTKTLSADTPIQLFRIVIYSGATLNNLVFKPMLEKGSQATSYLPYNTLEVVKRGKNLAHIEVEGKYRQASNGNFATNSSFNSYISSVKPNTSYIASCKNIATYYTEISNLCFFDVNMNFISGNNYNTSNKAFTTPNNCYYVTMAVNVSIEELQLETGSTATDYEPYQTPTSYPISLGNNKFCSIGDYADELLYDVDEDKVYKNEVIGTYMFTGEENWGKSGNTSNNGFLVTISDIVANALKPSNNNTNANVLCNYFISYSVNYALNNNKIGIGMRSDGVILIATSLSGIDDTDDFKSWLSTHNTIVYYILATPTLTEITDTTLKQQVKNWYYAQSYNATTIIESNGDLPMIIKVRGLKGES